jgi:imidazolonepropionase-like amidohydrolase
MPFQVHAVSPPAQVAAVRLGARRLIHSSHYAFMTDAQAQEIAAAGAMVSSSNSVPSPVFGIFNHDNKPTYRDGAPWPKGMIAGEDRGQGIGKFPVNSRTLFDNGVTFAYSSDTDYNATAGLAQELKILNLVFSPIDLVQIMGPNSAAFVDHGADRGTLEAGKLADILILTGNPLDGYWNFLKPVVVIKGGQIVVDKRAQLRTVKTL